MKLELTKQDVETIYTALGEIPAKISFDLIVKLQRQEKKEKQEQEQKNKDEQKTASKGKK